MENTTKAIWILLLVPLLFGLAQAQSAQSGALSLANVAVMPTPVVAGSNVTISFQLYDSYNDALSDVNLQLTGSYPLLNYSPSGTYLISTMGEGLYAGYFTYKLHVPNNTATGTYGVDFVATYHATQNGVTTIGTANMPLSFYVSGVPNVTAVAYSSQVVPGSPFVLHIFVTNSGYDTAKDLVITPLNATGFSPFGVSQLNVGSLPAGASINASASYQVGKTISNGTYTLPIAISYKSGLGRQYSETLNLTETVAIASPQIKLSFANPEPAALYQGYNQTVQLVIQNIGSGTAKNVSVDLQANNGTNLLGSVDDFFIGTLQAGQSVEEPVLLSSTGTGTNGNASVIAGLSYYSASYGTMYTGEHTLNLALTPAAQFNVTGESSSVVPGSTDVPIVFVVKNTGTMAAQEMQLSLQSTYPITPVAGTYYVSNLAPGASANVTFLVSADSQGAPGNYPVTIYEQWKQANGAVSQQFSGSNNYYVSVNQAPGISTTEMAAGVVVVLILVIFFARKRMGAAKKGKEKAKGK
jgi:hypothetical protein